MFFLYSPLHVQNLFHVFFSPTKQFVNGSVEDYFLLSYGGKKFFSFMRKKADDIWDEELVVLKDI